MSTMTPQAKKDHAARELERHHRKKNEGWKRYQLWVPPGMIPTADKALAALRAKVAAHTS